MKQYDAILFDLYGTLVHIHTDENQPSLWRRMAGFYASHGAGYAPRELRAAYLSAVRAAEATLAGQARGIPGACPEIRLGPVFARLYADKGAAANEALIRETAWVFRRASTTHLRLYAGARDLLDGLRSRGRKVYLLSNAQALFTLPELEVLGLSNSFDGIYLSSEEGCKKPDPRFFRRLLDRERLDSSRCLMIGNDPICDGQGARNLGMDVWCIRSALSPRDIPLRYDQQGMDLRALARHLR